jgi:N-acetyl-anhydromuramyl-L-alanine amidase AmpD
MGRFVSAAPDAIRTRKAGVAVDRIVIHTMQGTLAGSIAWFASPGRAVPTAAHYLIGDTGEIVQMVPDEKKALHAGSTTQANWNDRSIGIEHAGYVDDGKPPTDAMLASSAKVAAIMCRKFAIPVDRAHILGHVEVPGSTHTDPGAEWPWDRYMGMVASERATLG